jgi:hypothetical protein
VESDLVRLGGAVAAALLRPDVDDRRSGQRERALEGLQECVQVVTGDDPDVRDPEVLEELAGLGEVDDRLAEPLAQLERRRTDDRDPLGRFGHRRSCPAARLSRA